VTNGDGNKYQQKKTQLIEIDKLINNSGNENGPKDGKKSSKIGVWHQVRKCFLILCSFAFFSFVSFSIANFFRLT